MNAFGALQAGFEIRSASLTILARNSACICVCSAVWCRRLVLQSIAIPYSCSVKSGRKFLLTNLVASERCKAESRQRSRDGISGEAFDMRDALTFTETKLGIFLFYSCNGCHKVVPAVDVNTREREEDAVKSSRRGSQGSGMYLELNRCRPRRECLAVLPLDQNGRHQRADRVAAVMSAPTSAIPPPYNRLLLSAHAALRRKGYFLTSVAMMLGQDYLKQRQGAVSNTPSGVVTVKPGDPPEAAGVSFPTDCMLVPIDSVGTKPHQKAFRILRVCCCRIRLGCPHRNHTCHPGSRPQSQAQTPVFHCKKRTAGPDVDPFHARLCCCFVPRAEGCWSSP
jgi:hypothetical protein